MGHDIVTGVAHLQPIQQIPDRCEMRLDAPWETHLPDPFLKNAYIHADLYGTGSMRSEFASAARVD